jgi:uncharacterized protein (TIGR02001 family)
LWIVAVLLLGFALPSSAQSGFGGTVGVVSDYVYRGLSLTRGEPALQAGAHYTSLQGWTVGIWGSTVEFNWWDGRTAELDAFASYRWSIDRDWTASVSVTHYAYPWNDNRFDYDYDELAGSIGFRNMAFLTVTWSPNADRFTPYGYVSDKDVFSFEAAFAIPLGYSFTANAGIGYYDLSSLVGDGYTYWNAGLSYDFNAWRADISYIDTSDNTKHYVFRNLMGDRVAAGISWRF